MPSVAKREDWPTVKAILDLRSAAQAWALWDNGDGADRLDGSPGLTYWKNVIVFGEETADDIARAEPMEGEEED